MDSVSVYNEISIRLKHNAMFISFKLNTVSSVEITCDRSSR